MFANDSPETHLSKSNYYSMNDPFKWKSLKFLLHSLFGDKTVRILSFKLNPRFTASTRSGIS